MPYAPRNGQEARIRPAVEGEAEALSALAGNLGYSSDNGPMRDRLAPMTASRDHAELVAESNAVVGWIHLSRMRSVQRGERAVIRALAVTVTARGVGLGSPLVEPPDRWTGNIGFHRMRVRTNAEQEETRSL
jgi:predicted N-acetyltransferase YhbS